MNHHVVNFLGLILWTRKTKHFHLLENQTTTHSTSTIDLTTHLLSLTISLPLSTNASPRFLPIKHPLTLLHHFTNALKRSNYDVPLQYSACDNSSSSPSTNRRRRRNIIWFNPPFSKTVQTNVGRNFLQLIDKHFPSTNPLHKVFNRNTVKVSYSCMENVKTIISRHNHRLLKRNPTQKPLNATAKNQMNAH